MTMKIFRATLVVWALFAGAAIGQEGASSDPPSDIVLMNNPLRSGAFSFEYGVPATPALTIIGANGDSIPTNANLQRFAMSVLRASEETGGGAAAGLDFSPFWGMESRTMSWQTYRGRSSNWERSWYRARISAAFNEGNSGDEAPSRAAVGVATSLLDSSDPAMLMVPADELDGDDPRTGNERGRPVPYFSACVLNARRAAGNLDQAMVLWAAATSELRESERANDPHTRIVQLQARQAAAAAAFVPEYSRVAQECRQQTQNVARRRRAWDVGLATQWAGDPGSLDNMEPAGTSLWSTITTGASGATASLDDDASEEANFRGVAHIRLDVEAADFTTPTTRIEYDRQTVAIGIERLTRRSTISLQASYRNDDGPAGSEFDGESYQYLLRADVPAGDFLGGTFGENTWLSVSVGAIDGDQVENDSYVSVALRFKAPERSPVIGDAWSGQRR
jgi:hypothetical protein